MEKELYQTIAEEVRNTLQTTVATDRHRYPLIRNPTTLKGGCQDAAVMIQYRLRQCGEGSKLLKLHYRRGERPLEQGTHIVVSVDGFIIDPTITQFYPESKEFVFLEDTYPLPVARREDVSNSTFFR